MADRSPSARRPGESTDAYGSRLREQAMARARERKPAPLFIVTSGEPYRAPADDE